MPTLLTITTAALALTGTMLAGCAAPKPPPSAPPHDDADINTDPTAVRLHELSGQLLLHYARHRQLPQRLQDLSDGPSAAPNRSIIDPASGQAFLYRPNGLTLPELPGRLVVIQPMASSTAGRWALVIDVAEPPRPLVMYVQRLPEVLVRAALAPSAATDAHEPPKDER